MCDWKSAHYLRFCSSQAAWELMYWRLSMAWRRTSYCLQSNEVVYLTRSLLKYQMTKGLYWLKTIFLKLETPKLWTVYILECERVYFSMTGNTVETWHISSLTFSFSRSPYVKIGNYGNSMARTVGQGFRYLPHRSQACSLRKSWILMAEGLAKKTIMKHSCGLSIMILSVKRWSLIKSRLSCFLLAC